MLRKSQRERKVMLLPGGESSYKGLWSVRRVSEWASLGRKAELQSFKVRWR
jgi:hypothetical protein